jgi:hypothetical protein
MLIGYQVVPVETVNQEEVSKDKTPMYIEPGEIRRRTRRSLLVAGAAAAIGGGLWKWLNSWPRIDGLNAPFRRVLDFNAAIAREVFRDGTRAPEYERSKAVHSFRRNGDLGLAELKIEDWRLQLVGVGDVTSYSQYSKDVTSWMYGANPPTDESDEADTSVPAKKTAMHEDDAKGAAVSMKPMEMRENAYRRIPELLLTMADVRKLPRVEMITEFKCIEGWSEIVYWVGCACVTFLKHFHHASRMQASCIPQNL